ncbi:YihY/virulence factor BrkB family protein [Mongoliibacter ruber]|uniref:Membrane protein n=1 Tax=Mongoliibacter ruber TaxID=1750599 RepID=A0A2T0WKI1_9BACT|nr:YihY/virulence factor BrkB family protein [Mongoliibacter ruber]PRY87162.1 membrane protein [Mongoliibacter ruber]
MENHPKRRIWPKLADLPKLLLEAFKIWNANNPWRLGAVVAYYAVLSLPGLLIVVINTVGAIWGNELVEGEISEQIEMALGASAAQGIAAIVENSQEDKRTVFASIIGVGVLIFGATGVFYQLQISINEIWNAKIDPNAGYWKIIKDRAISLAFVMVIVFLLMISFVASTAISMMSGYLSNIWDHGLVVFAQAMEFLFSTAILGCLFVLIFKYMPDVRLPFGTVWLGGIITGLLFNIGKFLLSIYFSVSDPGSTYGAAGSVVLVLLWVSYSCLILFYGTAFTRVFAEKYGYEVIPSRHALIVEEKERVVKKGIDYKEE